MSGARPESIPAFKAGRLGLALVLFLVTLTVPVDPARADPAGTHADDFATFDFTGDTGTLTWSGDWLESGEVDGPAAGSIQVRNEPHCATSPCLTLGRDAGPNASIEREVDLSGAATATLEFNFKRHEHTPGPGLPGAGTIDLDVSDDGGSSWYPLDSWILAWTDGGMQSASYDISAYLAPDTRIRFSVNGSTDDSHLNVDNLVVTVGNSWYLKGDGIPSASLGGFPTQTSLPNYDPLHDAEDGRYIQKTENGLIAEIETDKHQWWVSPARAQTLDGPVTLTLWSAMQDFNTGLRGVVDAGLFDCLPDGSDCNLISTAQLDLADWSGGTSNWVEREVDFGSITAIIPGGRSLAVKIVVADNSGDDMWFAYDTVSYPSRLNVTLIPPSANLPPVFDQDLLDRTDPENAIISVSATATDPDTSDVLTYGATGLPPGLTINTGNGLISGTIDFTAAAGSPYLVTITATDDGTPNLADVDTFTWTITDVNREPIFSQDLLDRADPEGTLITIAAPAI